MPADVDETVHPGESAAGYARRVAEAKAQAILARSHGRPVLAADTVVVIDGQILGKPADDADAQRMLRLLSGRVHEVVTAVTLDEQTVVETTSVEMAPLTGDEIAWYVGTGEPSDKAGAYAVQRLASRFVIRIDGSYSNVVGLPIARVYRLLAERGRV